MQRWRRDYVLLGVAAACAFMMFDVRYDIALTLMPSAERAYAYGVEHFDARDARAYDIERAERFFKKAAALDPAYPYVLHQLARIAFLKGEYPLALERIDREIEQSPRVSPSSFYVRGLIKGFAGDYAGAALDYETYLRSDPTNWAAINDYAWVLLKDDRPLDALVAADWGLIYWPENPWLLNSKATAHFELAQNALALEAASSAGASVGSVSEDDWLEAYPGNDPRVAREGVEALRAAIEANIHSIMLASGGAVH